MPAFARHDLSCTQNFLTDPHLAAALIASSGITRADLVLEIGAGRGLLTEQLALACREVLAVEKDARLFAFLRQKLARRPNVRLYLGDFLDVRLPDGPYKVFANLPFNITSAAVTRLTSAQLPPEEACLVLQREAAQMYLGQPRECLRSVLLKPWFEVELAHRFRRTDFTPAPAVDAALLRLRRRKQPLAAAGFRDFVCYAFSARRATLGGTFRELFSWAQLKRLRRELRIDLDATPSALSFEQWLGAYTSFERAAGALAVQRVWGSAARLAVQQGKLEKTHRTRAARRKVV